MTLVQAGVPMGFIWSLKDAVIKKANLRYTTWLIINVDSDTDAFCYLTGNYSAIRRVVSSRFTGNFVNTKIFLVGQFSALAACRVPLVDPFLPDHLRIFPYDITLMASAFYKKSGWKIPYFLLLPNGYLSKHFLRLFSDWLL